MSKWDELEGVRRRKTDRSHLTKGRGYWLWLHCQKHMQLSTRSVKQLAEVPLTCAVCGKHIQPDKPFIYVKVTGECVCLSACFSLYPKSVWIEKDTGKAITQAERRTKAQKEEEYFLKCAVDEVLIEQRDVEEVAEEYDVEVEVLVEAVNNKTKEDGNND